MGTRIGTAGRARLGLPLRGCGGPSRAHHGPTRATGNPGPRKAGRRAAQKLVRHRSCHSLVRGLIDRLRPARKARGRPRGGRRARRSTVDKRSGRRRYGCRGTSSLNARTLTRDVVTAPGLRAADPLRMRRCGEVPQRLAVVPGEQPRPGRGCRRRAWPPSAGPRGGNVRAGHREICMRSPYPDLGDHPSVPSGSG